ncbi:hypothetical protein [Methanobrevibacter sp.]|uniref:hypothetical protein n=1 Tax=Methanobrevibacter sp. TaxID=66852 RepID=UPI00386E740A
MNILIRDISSPKAYDISERSYAAIAESSFSNNYYNISCISTYKPSDNSTTAILKSLMLYLAICIIRLLVTFTSLNIGI